MKIICSINGCDGSGKTTQVNIFETKKIKGLKTIYGLEKYKGFPKIEGKKLHDWWFKESSINEFCDAMFESLTNRNKDIEKSKENIIIIDKGLINFEARIRATLKIRGYSEKEIEYNIKKSKEKFGFKDIENLKIFIKNDKLNMGKVEEKEYTKIQNALYKKYEKEQILVLKKYLNKFDYIIDYDLGIQKTNKIITNCILSKILSDNTDVTEKQFEKLEKIHEQLTNDESIFYENKNYNAKYENYKLKLIENANKLKKINKKIQIKPINKYKIPVFYKKILESFIKELTENVDGLELVLIHGSAGRECMHTNWSDLDIIIGLEKYRFSEIDKIASIVEKYKENIKIGTTIYSRLEIESLNVDAKSLYALYQMQNEEILPTIYKNVKIPTITKQNLNEKNMAVLPEAIHKLKRLLYKKQKYDKEAIIKTLNLIMKVVLISNNIFFKSYEEVFMNFAKLYNIEELDIARYLNKKEDIKEDLELIQYAKEVIELLINEEE